MHDQESVVKLSLQMKSSSIAMSARLRLKMRSTALAESLLW